MRAEPSSILNISVTGSIASSDEVDEIATVRLETPATTPVLPTAPPLQPALVSGSIKCSLDSCSLLLLLLDDEDAVAEEDDDELLFPDDALRGFNCGACRA